MINTIVSAAGIKHDIITIDSVFMNKVLSPYHKEATYLKGSTLEMAGSGIDGLVARGEFSIPTSCYINDTGHFNAVEYNICYNQLAYTAIAFCIKERLLAELSDYTIDTFFENQLSQMLICRINSNFPKMLNAKHFYGEWKINSMKKVRHLIVGKTSCKFWDEADGQSDGEVVFAILPPK